MAELVGDIMEFDAFERIRERHPPVGGNGAEGLGRRFGAQPDQTEPAAAAKLRAHHFRRLAAAGGDPVVRHPQRMAARLGPLGAQHPQIRPGQHHRVALQRQHRAFLVVIVADVALVHFPGAEARNHQAIEPVLAHQRAHRRPAAVALGERKNRGAGVFDWHDDFLLHWQSGNAGSGCGNPATAV